MKRIFAAAALAAAFASMAAAAPFKKGQTLYVSVRSAELRDGSGTLDYGDVVIVDETGERRSLVHSKNRPSLKGWVANGSLTKKRIIASGGAMADADYDEIVLAGKGFSEEAENAYRAANEDLDFDAVDAIEQISVSPDEVRKFAEAGRLLILEDAK